MRFFLHCTYLVFILARPSGFSREGLMSFRFGKKTRTLIKSPGAFIIRWCARIVMLTPLLVATLQASTLLDPQPEHSSTLFGYSIAVVGDVDGDGVPDLAVGAPFQDGDFAGAPGFGPPQNVGKVFLISGRTLAVIRQLKDPEFEMVQSQKFGGQLGASGKDTPVVGDSQVGIAYIFSGRDGRVIRSLNFPSPGPSDAGANFGAAVANASQHEVLIGAPRRSRAFMFNAATGALKFTINSPITERRPSFGFAVAAGKDLSGDGTPDFAIGAPLLNNLHGVVFIFSGIDGSLQRTLRSPDSQAFARFGASIFLSSDVTGDGRPDIL